MHELPGELAIEEQWATIERDELFEPLTGIRPIDHPAPWWHLSLESPDLLVAAGLSTPRV